MRTDKAVSRQTVGATHKQTPHAGAVISDPTLNSSTAKNYKVQHAVTVAVSDDGASSRPSRGGAPHVPPASAKPGAKRAGTSNASSSGGAEGKAGASAEATAVAAADAEPEVQLGSIRQWLEHHNFDLKYEQILFEAVSN